MVTYIKCIRFYVKDFSHIKLRLGAQSFTLLNALRDPTQLRRRQWATRQGQDILFIHD